MGNNDLAPENNAERLAKSIVDLTKNSAKVDCLVNMSVLYIYLEMTITALKMKKYAIFLEACTRILAFNLYTTRGLSTLKTTLTTVTSNGI